MFERLNNYIKKVRLRFKVALVLPLLLVLLLHKSRRTLMPSLDLTPQDQAKVYIHGNTIVTASVDSKGKEIQTVHYVPDHATIEVKKNGEVITSVQQVGFKCDPYLGITYGDTVRIQSGIQFLYFHKLNIGAGIGWAYLQTKDQLRVNVNAQYNIYNNTYIFVGMDHKQTILGGLSFRF